MNTLPACAPLALPVVLSLGIVPMLSAAFDLGPYRVDDVETGLAIAEQGDRALLGIQAEATRLELMKLPEPISAEPSFKQ